MNKLLFSVLAFLSLNFATLSATDSNYESNDELKKMTDLITSVLSSSIHKADFSSPAYPKVDIQNTADAYIYSFNLAGMEKKDIKLRIDTKDMLILEGEKEDKNKTVEDGFTKQEIFYGSFKRALQLPQDANQEKLSTKYINGILTVTLPKQELKQTSSKLIPIN